MQKNMEHSGIFLFQIYYICKDEQEPSYHSDYIHALYGNGYDGHVHYANASLRCCIFPFRFILSRGARDISPVQLVFLFFAKHIIRFYYVKL